MNIFLFLLLVLTIISVSAEKSNLDDPVLFCDGCFALVSEIDKDMSVRYVRTWGRNLMDNLTKNGAVGLISITFAEHRTLAELCFICQNLKLAINN